MQPKTIAECQEMIRSQRNLMLRGGGSKPALSTAVAGGPILEMGGLNGIIEYDPGEYTFTALAGTAVAEIQEALAQNNQYLPFDPLLAAAGATLGGTVAANLSGSGRTRYGGVRDFILGIQFIDGHGRLIRSGGKVVKNAAGFDLPKFMVGSLGRYGALVEITFKVFPQPAAYQTLVLHYEDVEATLHALFSLASQPFEMDALDVVPQANGRAQLHIRLGGLAEALPPRIERLRNYLTENTAVTDHETLAADHELWQAVNRFEWAKAQSTWVKVPIALRQLPVLDTAVAKLGGLRRYSAGGNVAWLALTDPAELDTLLHNLKLVGLVLRGTPGRFYLGRRRGGTMAAKVKLALDPDGTFLPDNNMEQRYATHH